ncbi:MAG: VCBS repeat-containing protein [Nitrospira sp.]|nr:VCBS repeat-containing protein [Nitrospira sp.]
MPAVYDYRNADGYVEPLGLQNDGSGILTNVSAMTLGLSPLFSIGRVNRDCRLADFNGDGFTDLVCNTYSPAEVYTVNLPTAGESEMGPICTDASASFMADSVALLFLNNQNGAFTEDRSFTRKAIRGYGETIVVADFNNDGFLDIFLPYYSHCSKNEHSYLLINDGNGNFTDIADNAGVALRGISVFFRVEGAQALDFNNDGWMDFYVGGHFFINNQCIGESCHPTFSDQRAALGLPLLFDEGVKFLDWNNDGLIDIVVHHPETGPTLYQFNGRMFEQLHVIPTFHSGTYNNSYGMNIYDLNNDGTEDIFLSGGSSTHERKTVILLNDGTSFQRANETLMDGWGGDIIAFGDTNKDGRIDVIKRIVETGMLAHFRNETTMPVDTSLSIDVVGSTGEKNQQGRVVKITPQHHTNITFTRIVDSGSGFMAQNQYDLLVGTPYPEAHTAKVYFHTGMVQFVINPGERKRVYPNGTVVDY